MQEEVVERIKVLFMENERLFTKLNMVAQQYEAINFDESGLYEDDEQAVLRRWEKLTTKIAEAMSEAEGVARVTVAKKEHPLAQHVSFDVTMEDDAVLRMGVDYAEDGQLSIVCS